MASRSVSPLRLPSPVISLDEEDKDPSWTLSQEIASALRSYQGTTNATAKVSVETFFSRDDTSSLSKETRQISVSLERALGKDDELAAAIHDQVQNHLKTNQSGADRVVTISAEISILFIQREFTDLGSGITPAEQVFANEEEFHAK